MNVRKLKLPIGIQTFSEIRTDSYAYVDKSRFIAALAEGSISSSPAWTGEAVYNPFDVLLFLDERIYKSWWFETGTPSFLIKLLGQKPRSLPELDGLVAGEEILGSFDIEDLRLETMLFQAGYLTIKDSSSDPEEGTRYTLGFPNREVRAAFSRSVLAMLRGDDGPPADTLLRCAIEVGDTEALRTVVHSFFASIPNDWYRKNRLSEFEGYYSSVVYACFASVGYEVVPEDVTERGRNPCMPKG